MKRGLVIGKFMPMHQGHVTLLEHASSHCDLLTIVVCSMDDEPILGEQRLTWIHQQFPHARVKWLHQEMPQEPQDEHDDHFWDLWRTELKRLHPEKVHRVFGSEPSILRLAKEMDQAEPCIFDIKREQVPISGTTIRQSPYDYWEYIPKIVRPFYVKRILITGPESCGKTTLAQRLAEIWNTTWTPEYAREYIETELGNNMDQLTPKDLNIIAERHYEQEHYAWLNGHHVTFSDTCAIETEIYANEFFGYVDPFIISKIEPERYDLALLMRPDIPWEADPQRNLPDRRQEFYGKFKEKLEQYGIPYVEVGGLWEERIGNASVQIHQLMREINS